VKENLVVAIDGMSADEAKSLFNDVKIPSGAATTPSKPQYVGGEVKVRNNDSSSIAAGIAFATPSGTQSLAFDVLQHTLCSRLSKKKLSTSVFHNKYSSSGLFGVQMKSSTSADLENTLKAVTDELKAIANNSSGAESGKNVVRVVFIPARLSF
jgi:hypothetical protein